MKEINVQQFVMAYRVEQDRIRAFLPEGFESLRPVIRINAEIRREEDYSSGNLRETVYLELNTPVSGFRKRGWLNIDNWSSDSVSIKYEKKGASVKFNSPFLEIEYKGRGIRGGCPAEKDNEGCFFVKEGAFIPAEKIDSKKEFCDCEFKWRFSEGNAWGKSSGEGSIQAYYTESKNKYERQELRAETAADIECQQVLGAYKVEFERNFQNIIKM